MWGQGVPHGPQDVLRNQLWHLEHPAQPWPGQHPGVPGAALHPAVPTDPGTPKQCRGPTAMACVGLGRCPHPRMGHEWGARLNWGCQGLHGTRLG